MGASAATNTTGHPLRQIKIPWRWVSCAEQRWCTFIYMVVLKKMVCKDSGPALAWLGLVSAGVGDWGGGGGLPPPPQAHT